MTCVAPLNASPAEAAGPGLGPLNEAQCERLRNLIRPYLQPRREGARECQNAVIRDLEFVRAEYSMACEASAARTRRSGRRPTQRIKDQLGRVRTTARKLRQLLHRLLADEGAMGSEPVRSLESALGTAALTPTEQAQLLMRLALGGTVAPPSADSERLRAVLRVLEQLEIATAIAAVSQPHGRRGAPYATRRILNAGTYAVLMVHGLPDRLRRSIVRTLLESLPKK
jgi:hypothetical protein